MPRIGVLALQGDFARHEAAFDGLGQTVVQIRHACELEGVDGLVIPGGESTTLLNLMRHEPWFDELRRFHDRGGVLFGTCAGAILLSREVCNPAQPSLGLLDATIRRNAFGRQVDSFESEVDLQGSDRPLPAVFIRAPRFLELGREVDVLARLREEPVLVRQGRVMAATFHPELTDDRRLQQMFIEMTLDRVTTDGTDSRHQTTDGHPPVLVARERRISC